MNINQLKYFIALAETESFSKAAEQFFISQTAITQQMRALEQSIGIKLIDRSTRPISLTPGGKIFFREAKAIVNHMDMAVMRSQEASTGLSGTLRIGYTKGYEQGLLPRLLREFRREYPNIFLTCFRNDTDLLAAGIASMEYDVIFTWDSTNIRLEDSLQTRLLERLPLYVALYSNHPLARRESLRREDLKGENLLFMSPSGHGDSFGDAFYIRLYQQAGYQPNILLKTGDYESIIMMVAAEEAISVIPEYCVGRLRNVENVTFLPLQGESETEEILAVWNQKNQNPVLQNFLDKLPTLD